MRILSVCVTMPSETAEWWRISNIANILRARGHRVDFIHYVPRNAVENNEDELSKNARVFITNFPGRANIEHLRMLVNEKDYDLVYANTHLACYFSLIGRLCQVPLVFDIHGDLVAEYRLHKGRLRNLPFYSIGLFKRGLIDVMDSYGANLIVCVSRKMIQSLQEKGVSSNRIAYVTNGVDLDFFRQSSQIEIDDLKAKLGLEEKFVVGYVGRYQKWQGVQRLIEAANSTNDDEIAYLFVGGENRFETRNIISLRELPRKDICTYYSICDILILPRPDNKATQIAAPMKFSEYAAMGKPILTTRVGDAADLVQKYSCGLVVDSNSPEHLIKGINDLKSRSKTELSEMGYRSRRMAEIEYDWRKIGEDLVKSVESLK